MDDATSVSFNLPQCTVIECVELDKAVRKFAIIPVAVQHGCPRCGVVIGGKAHPTRESRTKDLPFGERHW